MRSGRWPCRPRMGRIVPRVAAGGFQLAGADVHAASAGAGDGRSRAISAGKRRTGIGGSAWHVSCSMVAWRRAFMPTPRTENPGARAENFNEE